MPRVMAFLCPARIHLPVSPAEALIDVFGQVYRPWGVVIDLGAAGSRVAGGVMVDSNVNVRLPLHGSVDPGVKGVEGRGAPSVQQVYLCAAAAQLVRQCAGLVPVKLVLIDIAGNSPDIDRFSVFIAAVAGVDGDPHPLQAVDRV